MPLESLDAPLRTKIFRLRGIGDPARRFFRGSVAAQLVLLLLTLLSTGMVLGGECQCVPSVPSSTNLKLRHLILNPCGRQTISHACSEP